MQREHFELVLALNFLGIKDIVKLLDLWHSWQEDKDSSVIVFHLLVDMADEFVHQRVIGGLNVVQRLVHKRWIGWHKYTHRDNWVWRRRGVF